MDIHIWLFRDDARSPNGRRMSLRPTPVDFFAISSSLHVPRLRRRETEMWPKRRPLKAMRPSRDHPETCDRVGVNFVKSEKRADRDTQLLGNERARRGARPQELHEGRGAARVITGTGQRAGAQAGRPDWRPASSSAPRVRLPQPTRGRVVGRFE
jgi:hypothetical protein